MSDPTMKPEKTESEHWLSPPPRGLTTDVAITDVYDGDTVTVQVVRDARIRIIDCWCPEIRTRDADEKRLGLECRDYLIALLARHGGRCRMYVPSEELNRLGDYTSMGRYLGHLWVEGEDRPLARLMCERGFASATKADQPVLHTPESAAKRRAAWQALGIDYQGPQE